MDHGVGTDTEHTLTGGGGKFDVAIPAGQTIGSIVLHPDRTMAVEEWQAVGWEVLPGGRSGDHVRFRIAVTRLVKPRSVVPVWEGISEEIDPHLVDAYEMKRHILPHNSPITVRVELLDGPRALQVIVRNHITAAS